VATHTPRPHTQEQTVTPDPTTGHPDEPPAFAAVALAAVTGITLKRYCDNGHLVGDATDAEVLAAARGHALPSARLDCVECRDELNAAGGAL
uniref:hypothetical protein n=1 Tax=Streptomyces sp. SBT349 TaxID=1580539 RepID=UPI001F22C4AA